MLSFFVRTNDLFYLPHCVGLLSHASLRSSFSKRFCMKTHVVSSDEIEPTMASTGNHNKPTERKRRNEEEELHFEVWLDLNVKKQKQTRPNDLLFSLAFGRCLTETNEFFSLMRSHARTHATRYMHH